MIRILLYTLSILLFVSCKEDNNQKEKHKDLIEHNFQEKFRPQFHFTPEESWMNDPNGLVYNDGVYHLFYQFYPDATVWGPMHWGHATSKDMIHWEHKPIALYPDEKGFIFSGSAVVDNENTSGFGRDGKTPLVAIYTYFRLDIEKRGGINTQTQGIAYSLDNGVSWTKYDGNPIIDNKYLKDFRDPKVFWHEKSESWIMALVAGDHVKFYRSLNLKEWDNISDFGKDQGSHGGVWECPDLFKLKVEGTDEERWVLIISIGSGGPNGGSGSQYFVGDFDGTTFTSNQKEFKWLDWGTDNYAGVTYNNTPTGNRVFIGWMSNWQYALSTPTDKWRSAMTLPRELSLKKYGNSYLLHNYPLERTNDVIEESNEKLIELEGHSNIKFSDNGLNQNQISFKTSSRDFDFTLSNKIGEKLSVKFDGVSNLVMIDRTMSGLKNFHPEFGNKLHYMPINELTNKDYEVRILIDKSSVELFINKGQYVMTEQIFPTEDYTEIEIQNNSDELLEFKEFHVDKVSSIWE